MRRVSFARMECPIARAAEQIGDGWSMLLLRQAFLGTRCFQDFEERLGIPPSTLARRLKLLCRQGIMVRARYHTRPPRDEYVLTQKGRELMPVLLCMAVWGNRWLAPQGAPLLPIDLESGVALDPVLVDRHTGRVLTPGSVAIASGPGASKRLRRALARPLVLGAATNVDETR